VDSSAEGVERAPGTFPVTFTPEALDRLRNILTKDGRVDAFLRVGVKGGGCSGFEYVLKLDTLRRPSDMWTQIDGVPVACDPKSARFLAGCVVQFTGNLIGGGFAFDNPNAERSCGCGTSFTPKT
jgi:iron-sulfur cluster assembly protein